MIKVVLFDLDDTLLPMDQDVFCKGLFRQTCKEARTQRIRTAGAY